MEEPCAPEVLIALEGQRSRWHVPGTGGSEFDVAGPRAKACTVLGMLYLDTARGASPASGSGTPGTADGSPDERQEQREDAGSCQDGAQALRGILPHAGRNLRQRHAAEVYEVGPYGRPQQCQDYCDQ